MEHSSSLWLCPQTLLSLTKMEMKESRLPDLRRLRPLRKKDRNSELMNFTPVFVNSGEPWENKHNSHWHFPEIRERKISPMVSCIKFCYIWDVPTQIPGDPGHSLSKTTEKGHLHKVFVRDIASSGSPSWVQMPAVALPELRFWRVTKEYLNHKGTKIRVFRVRFRTPLLPRFFHHFPPSFPFRPCALSHHSSPLHLPIYPPPFWVLENSDLGTPLI